MNDTTSGLPRNPDGLRVIETARTTKAINAGVERGLWPLIKPVIQSPHVHRQVAVFQHRETGEVVTSGDVRYSPDPHEEYVLAVSYQHYYPYHFPAPFAAYLLPEDLGSGEEVWIDDLIEDVVAVWGNQGYQPRLDSCNAIWRDGDFELLFDPGRDAQHWIG